jgi:uncharacterized membrane protein (DUF485 family)
VLVRESPDQVLREAESHLLKEGYWVKDRGENYVIFRRRPSFSWFLAILSILAGGILFVVYLAYLAFVRFDATLLAEPEEGGTRISIGKGPSDAVSPIAAWVKTRYGPSAV